MKNLYIVRHAKSDWSNGELADRERPLNARGLKDAPFMAVQFVKRAGVAELFLSSPAVRARTTCGFFARAAGIPECDIMIEEQLYFGSPESIVAMLQPYALKHNSIILFGHNPTHSNLAYLLCPDFLDDMPTCAIVAISFADSIAAGKGKLMWYDYPKRYGKEN